MLEHINYFNFNGEVVEMVRKSWNRIEKYIFEAYEMLKEHGLAHEEKAGRKFRRKCKNAA